MAYSVLGLDARYSLTFQANQWIVWMEVKTIMAFRTRTQAETYAKMHETLNNKIEGE